MNLADYIRKSMEPGLCFRNAVAQIENLRYDTDLPRAYEAVVRDYVKFRVGRLVFASVSPDESLLGFAYPKDGRESLVDSDPETFLMPVTLLSPANCDFPKGLRAGCLS